MNVVGSDEVTDIIRRLTANDHKDTDGPAKLLVELLRAVKDRDGTAEAVRLKEHILRVVQAAREERKDAREEEVACASPKTKHWCE